MGHSQDLPPHDVIAAQIVSPRGLTARSSTFDRRDVVQAFGAQARQGASLQEIEAFADTLLGREEIVTLPVPVAMCSVLMSPGRADGRTVSAIADARRYSTVKLLAKEQQVIEDVIARPGRGRRRR